MEQDIEKTKVIFRMTPKTKDYPFSDCIAFFPELDAHCGYMDSYLHCGQHGEASINYYYMCKPATEEQYRDLKLELENAIGYNLDIKKKRHFKKEEK